MPFPIDSQNQVYVEQNAGYVGRCASEEEGLKQDTLAGWSEGQGFAGSMFRLRLRFNISMFYRLSV